MKPDAKRRNMMIRVSDAQIAHVKMLAKEHACSMSAVLRHLIDVSVPETITCALSISDSGRSAYRTAISGSIDELQQQLRQNIQNQKKEDGHAA